MTSCSFCASEEASRCDFQVSEKVYRLLNLENISWICKICDMQLDIAERCQAILRNMMNTYRKRHHPVASSATASSSNDLLMDHSQPTGGADNVLVSDSHASLPENSTLAPVDPLSDPLKVSPYVASSGSTHAPSSQGGSSLITSPLASAPTQLYDGGSGPSSGSAGKSIRVVASKSYHCVLCGARFTCNNSLRRHKMLYCKKMRPYEGSHPPRLVPGAREKSSLAAHRHDSPGSLHQHGHRAATAPEFPMGAAARDAQPQFPEPHTEQQFESPKPHVVGGVPSSERQPSLVPLPPAGQSPDCKTVGPGRAQGNTEDSPGPNNIESPSTASGPPVSVGEQPASTVGVASVSARDVLPSHSMFSVAVSGPSPRSLGMRGVWDRQERRDSELSSISAPATTGWPDMSIMSPSDRSYLQRHRHSVPDVPTGGANPSPPPSSSTRHRHSFSVIPTGGALPSLPLTVAPHASLSQARPSPHEGQYSCDICSKRFAKHRYLVQHKNVHTEKRLQCGMCGTKFKWRSSLNEHRTLYCKKKPGGAFNALGQDVYMGDGGVPVSAGVALPGPVLEGNGSGGGGEALVPPAMSTSHRTPVPGHSGHSEIPPSFSVAPVPTSHHPTC